MAPPAAARGAGQVTGRRLIELRPTNRRLENFSDGIFAIAITIMVIDVRIPASLAFSNDPAALMQFSTALTAYALSFIVVANLWTSHHYLVFTLNRPTRSTIWFNNLLLFGVTMIPPATRFLGHFPTSSRAAASFGGVGFCTTAAFMLLRTHARRTSHNVLHQAIHRRVLRRTWLLLAIYAASIPLAFVQPWVSWLCFASVAAMLFVPVIGAQRARESTTDDHHNLERSCP
jgi:uncharacterized membrane protein